MARQIYIIPGILNGTPDDARKWNYQAQAWFHDRLPDAICDGFDYMDGAIGGTVALDAQAALIAEDLVYAQRNGKPTTLIGHSNGCRLALRALELAPELAPELEGVRLHLLAAACFENCDTNGLNAAAGEAQIGTPTLYADSVAPAQIEAVSVYVSAEDEILGGPLNALLGYGPLGKVGPKNVNARLKAVLRTITADPPCGHCDWVGRDFEKTMQMIFSAEASVTPQRGGTGTDGGSNAPPSLAAGPDSHERSMPPSPQNSNTTENA